MDFCKKMALAEPVPAGGAVAAYTLFLASGLVLKVVRFEIQREVAPDIEKNFMVARKELERLYGDAERLVERDSEHYTTFSRALKTGEISARKTGFSNVIDISMQVMEKSASVFFWVEQLYRFVPAAMTPHLQVAAELAMSAIKASTHIASYNIRLLKNDQKKENYLDRLHRINNDLQSKYDKLLKSVANES